MPDSVLFRVQKVNTRLKDYDMPGPTRKKVACSRCGQVVRDQWEVIIDNKPVCQPCTTHTYFIDAREITWDHMDWIPHNGTDILDNNLFQNHNQK